MAKLFRYEFEWDPAKARRNLKKHGIAFERAATLFLDPNALSELDEEHSEHEDGGSHWEWIEPGVCWSCAIHIGKRAMMAHESG